MEIPKELPKDEIWANYFVEGFQSIFYYTLPDIWDARVIGILNIFNLLGITPIQAKLIDKLQEEFGKDRKFYWNHINGLAKKWKMLNVEYDIHKNKKVYFVNREFILHDDPLTISGWEPSKYSGPLSFTTTLLTLLIFVSSMEESEPCLRLCQELFLGKDVRL